MQALVKFAPGVGGLELRELPDPSPGPGEIVFEVAATGVCGTDLHIQDGEYSVVPPVVIGHETAGTVTAIGAGVSGVRPGDRVTSLTTISTCGRCEYCVAGLTNLCPDRRYLGGHVNGGFARYVVVPEGNVLRLPDHVSHRAAALTEPLACCTHGILEVALPAILPAALPPGAERTRPLRQEAAPVIAFARGTTVVVSGPGPIGLLCAQVARAAGAEVLVLGTSADTPRFALARQVGLERLIDVQAQDPVAAVQEWTSGRGPDLVVEAAGAAGSLDQCLRLSRRRGVILQIGLYGQPVAAPVDLLVLKELRLLGSFSSTPAAWSIALDFLASGKVLTEPLVTSTRPLEQWAEAFRAARHKVEGKILLTPAG